MKNKWIREELIRSCREQGYSFVDICENYDMLLKIQNKNDRQITLSKSSTHKQYFNKLKDDSKKKKYCGYCQLNKGEECMYSDNK